MASTSPHKKLPLSRNAKGVDEAVPKPNARSRDLINQSLMQHPQSKAYSARATTPTAKLIPDENKSSVESPTQAIDALAEVATAQQGSPLVKAGAPRHSYEVADDDEDLNASLVNNPTSKENGNNQSNDWGLNKDTKSNERKYVVHNYVDHYNEEIESEYERKVQDMSIVSKDRRKALDLKFIVKLHFELENIEEDGKHDIMGWMPHGRSFRIHDRERFIDEILPNYFDMRNGSTSCTSFMRQLHMYGFTRLTRISGPDQGSYYNEHFLRGKAFLTCRIKRVKVNGKGYKHAANPLQEPNFYKMTKCAAPIDLERYQPHLPISHRIVNHEEKAVSRGSPTGQSQLGRAANAINVATLKSNGALNPRQYQRDPSMKTESLPGYGVRNVNTNIALDQRLMQLNNGSIEHARQPVSRYGLQQVHPLSTIDARAQIVYQPTIVYPDGNAISLAGHARVPALAPAQFYGNNELNVRPTYLVAPPIAYNAARGQPILTPVYSRHLSHQIIDTPRSHPYSFSDQRYLAGGNNQPRTTPNQSLVLRQEASQRGYRWDETQHPGENAQYRYGRPT